MSPHRILLSFLLVLLLTVSSCTTPTPLPDSSTPIIDSLELLPQAAEGAPLVAIVRGHLTTNCLTIDREQVQQNGSRIEITFSTTAQAQDTCRNGTFSFYKIVSLDLRSLPEGALTIQAGQEQAQFIPVQANLPPTATPLPTDSSPALLSPSATPTEAAAPPANPLPPALISPTPASPACINKAAYYGDITIPDGTAFDPGDSFTKTWRIRNEGTCNWSEAYALVFVTNDLMSAATSQPLPPAAAGEIIDVSVDFTAPAFPGAYTSYWQFQAADGQTFGTGAAGKGLVWVTIGVRAPVGERALPAATPGSTSADSCAYEQKTEVEAAVLGLINTARQQEGLKALALNSQLSKAALQHSADMACQDFVGHNGSDGSTWYMRITQHGLAYTRASENIYVGNPAFGGNAQGAFDWWMNSQVHRDNILDATFTKIGIGYVFSPSSSYGGYYTLVFSRP